MPESVAAKGKKRPSGKLRAADGVLSRGNPGGYMSAEKHAHKVAFFHKSRRFQEVEPLPVQHGRIDGEHSSAEAREAPCHHVPRRAGARGHRSEEHTSELQSLTNLVCRLLLEKKK